MFDNAHHHKVSFSMLIAIFFGFLAACNPVNELTGDADAGLLSASSKASLKTEAEIRDVIYNKYLGGQKLGSAEILKSAFNPDSVMLLPGKDEAGKPKLTRWTDMHDEASKWAENPDPNLNFEDHKILSLNVVDDRIAVVLLDVNGRVYDAITLAKIDDDWTIASKVYIPQ